ncbi:hypothetical protein J6I39_08055 [bacterium]|nr:hypothetical protein [bacterium]
MVAIKSLGKIVSSFIKTESTTLAQNDKAMFDFFKKMTSGYTKGHKKNDLPRICFEGSNYEELPSFVRSLADSLNLRRPNVIVRGRSLKEGQGILGFKICDGDKVVGTTSYGLDFTRGEPIQQFRVSIGNGTERAISFNSVLNTNLTGKSALKCDTFVNKKLANQMGLTDEMLQGIPSSRKVSARELNYQSQYLRELAANKGNMIHSIDECIDELAQIASKKGKVTEQSATEAIETVLSKMGYNPKDIKLKFVQKEFGNPGAFNQNSGKLEFDLSQIETHQDLADLIKHEFTHMEDYILFYKKVGADKFKKLIGEDYNQIFYDNMSKYLSKNKNFAYDGNKTTNMPRKFGIKSMEQELKRDIKYCQEADGSSYSRVKDYYEYINSDIEGHARFSEGVFVNELKRRGIYQETVLSRQYGRPPGSDPQVYSEMFKSIEKALSKYGANKGQKFNELYYQSLNTIDNELASLYKQMEKLPQQSKEFKMLKKKADEIIKSRHKDFEHLELNIMQSMQARLGLRPIPMPQEATLQAMQRMNPEIAEIEKAMMEGRPENVFEQLVKQKDELIAKYYGNRDEFGVKVAEEVRKIQREVKESNLRPYFEETDKLVTEAVETKQNLLNAYDNLIDYAKKYGTKESFELLG